MTQALDLSTLRFNSDGLIPAIIQQAGGDLSHPGRVLMMAWMNREALEATVSTRKMHYWSRSRKKLWLKGEQSGNTQEVIEWFKDCDGDTLLFQVRQHGGAACHTGYESCFFQRLDQNGRSLEIKEQPIFDPAVVYENPAK